MHPRFRNVLGALAILSLALAPLAACSPAKEGGNTAPGGAPGTAASEPAAPAGGIDVDAVVKKAQGDTEKIRLTMAASRETKIEVVGGKPGAIPGTVDLKIRVSREGRTAIRRLPVTADLKYAIVGAVLEIGRIPRLRVDLENVNLKDVPVRGNPNAPVTVVEYGDFQCPFCRASQPNIDRLLKEYDGKVKLVFKHYPLQMHEWAMDAALLSECARRQKPALFWKLHDYYYDPSTKLRRANILELTQAKIKGEGIDMDAFNKCYLDHEPLERIQKEIDEGKTIGVRGTPAFLINDVFLSGAIPYGILNAITLEELGQPAAGAQAAAAAEPADPGETESAP
jgi:protein-disulfide isomerase